MVSGDLSVLLNKKNAEQEIYRRWKSLSTKVQCGKWNLQHSWSVLLLPFSWWLLLTIFRSIEKPDSFWNTLLAWLRFGAKVKSLAEIDRRPLSELSIDKSFTKKSQNWRLYKRIQIWSCFVRVLRLFVLRTIVTEMVDACIASYRHWHGQLWLILRCWGKSSILCQQNSDAL